MTEFHIDGDDVFRKLNLEELLSSWQPWRGPAEGLHHSQTVQAEITVSYCHDYKERQLCGPWLVWYYNGPQDWCQGVGRTPMEAVEGLFHEGLVKKLGRSDKTEFEERGLTTGRPSANISPKGDHEREP